MHAYKSLRTKMTEYLNIMTQRSLQLCLPGYIIYENQWHFNHMWKTLNGRTISIKVEV